MLAKIEEYCRKICDENKRADKIAIRKSAGSSAALSERLTSKFAPRTDLYLKASPQTDLPRSRACGRTYLEAATLDGLTSKPLHLTTYPKAQAAPEERLTQSRSIGETHVEAATLDGLTSKPRLQMTWRGSRLVSRQVRRADPPTGTLTLPCSLASSAWGCHRHMM